MKQAHANRFANFKNSKTGEMAIMLAGIGMSYIFASLSINYGNLWYYLLTLVCLIVSLKFLSRLIKDIFHAFARK